MSRLSSFKAVFALAAFGAAFGIAHADAPAPTATPEIPAFTMGPDDSAPSGEETPLAGSNSVTASILSGQVAIEKTLASKAEVGGATFVAPSGADPAGNFAYYMEQYRYFQSTPYLYVLGLPLGQILNGFYFMTLVKVLLVAFVGIAVASKLKTGEGSIDFYASLILKLMCAGLIMYSPNLIYSACMTIMDAGKMVAMGIRQEAEATPGGAADRLSDVLAHTGTQDIELRMAKQKGVENAIATRAGVFTLFVTQDPQNLVDVATTDYWAHFFNQVAAAQRASYPNARAYPPLPSTKDAPVFDVRTSVVQRFGDVTSDSAFVDAGNRSVNVQVNWQYTPQGGEALKTQSTGVNMKSLADYIEEKTKVIRERLLEVGSSPADLEKRAQLLNLYESQVRMTTANWIDRNYIDTLAAAIRTEPRLSTAYDQLADASKRVDLGAAPEATKEPSFTDKVSSWMSRAVRAAQAAIVAPIGIVASFCFRLVLELSLLGMMLSVPLWFFEGTKRAFTGSVETLIACSIMLPMWMFFQLILDLLFRALSLVVLTGSVATTTGSVLTAGMQMLGPAGVGIVLALTLAYFLASLFLAFKTPSLTKGFLSGGAWVTSIIGTAAKGAVSAALIAGAAVTAGAGGAVGLGALGAAGAGGAGAGGAGAAGAAGAAKAAGGGTLSRIAGSRMGSLFRSVGSGFSGSAPAGGKGGYALGRGLRGGTEMTKQIILSGGEPSAALSGYNRAREEKRAKAAQEQAAPTT